jgi:hypothetical protein
MTQRGPAEEIDLRLPPEKIVPEKYAPDDLIEEFSMNNYCNKIHW